MAALPDKSRKKRRLLKTSALFVIFTSLFFAFLYFPLRFLYFSFPYPYRITVSPGSRLMICPRTISMSSVGTYTRICFIFPTSSIYSFETFNYESIEIYFEIKKKYNSSFINRFNYICCNNVNFVFYKNNRKISYVIMFLSI